MQALRVLLIDDDRTVRDSLSLLLDKAGFEVDAHFRASDALTAMSRSLPDVVLTDMRMPGMSGLDLLENTRELYPDLPVVLISAHGDVPLAVEAMGKGAHNFLEKPYHPGRLITVLQQAAQSHRLKQDNRNLRARLADLSGLDRTLMGETRAMSDLRAQVQDAALHQSPVMLLGETGTGKEVVARALHDLSPRCAGPFVTVHCASLPAKQFERLLFGDPTAGEAGYFVRADRGTLFLDEFEALSMDQQGALSRALESGEISPVGKTDTRQVDVRVVSAGSIDPQTAIADGRLRPDLYYRLGALSISLSPLRNRRDDIVLLFTHFLHTLAETYEITSPELTNDDLATLLAHEWPGNVRELRNVAERRILAARRGLGSVAEALATAEDASDIPDTLREAVAAFERQIIGKALIAHGGRMDAVAEALGIGRRTLNEKLVKLNIDREELI